MNREVKIEVCQALGVHSIENSKKYLGLPSIVGRNKKMAFRVLKEKCLGRFHNWGSRFLPIKGREILIKTVFQVISMFSMSCFFLARFVRSLKL